MRMVVDDTFNRIQKLILSRTVVPLTTIGGHANLSSREWLIFNSPILPALMAKLG